MPELTLNLPPGYLNVFFTIKLGIQEVIFSTWFIQLRRDDDATIIPSSRIWVIPVN